MRWLIAPIAAVALLTTACGDQDTTSPAALDDGADAVELGNDDPVDVTDDGETTDDGAGDDTSTDDASTGAATSGDGAFDPWADHPLEPAPGRWAVGDAGTVEFDLTDQGLVLVDVTEAQGWTARVDEESSDEIEVEFTRDDTKREIEIEWDGSTLEIDINTDIVPASDGVYEIGQAGSFEFSSSNGLQLRDVVVADGWELRMDDESADEIEFTVQRGDERWYVEIELDDGRVELEIDYRVRGTPAR
jgi:hypothetical protein